MLDNDESANLKDDMHINGQSRDFADDMKAFEQNNKYNDLDLDYENQDNDSPDIDGSP